MLFDMFYAHFPELAKVETRTFTVPNEGDILPRGEYGLLEWYCTDKKCDCRRVMIQVVKTLDFQNPERVAVLSFGWEPKAFYLNWSPSMPDEELAWFKGPAIDPFQPQSQYAEESLKLLKAALEDQAYRKRLIRHYALFKQKIGMKLPKDLKKWVVGGAPDAR